MPPSAYIIIITILYGVAIQNIVEADGDINIKVAQGELVGEWRTTRKGRQYGAFEGIPFAVPPLGEKRFLAPEPIKSWDGVRQAKTLPNLCIQMYNMFKDSFGLFGEEDCLYLTIYSPKPEKNAKLPVIIFVHGGAYTFGSGALYGCDFLMDKDIVCASVNYRLGPFGFLSTDDEVVPGNMGLKDQTLAMKWIKENVENFGGDSDCITIFGSSTGASSVVFHTMSPLSKGLFHRVIALSGSACNVWAFTLNQKDKTQAMASSLGCSTASSKEMIDCLRQIPATDIIKSLKMFTPFLQAPPVIFGPIVEQPGTENAFFLEDPKTSMEKGASVDVPILSSVTLDEGLYPVAVFLQDFKLLDELEQRWDELAPILYYFSESLSSSDQKAAAKKIKEVYMNGEPVSINTYHGLVDSFGDRYFIYGVEECSKLFAMHHKEPVYIYQFSYHGYGSFAKALSNSDINYGICHVDDVAHIMHAYGFDPSAVSEDAKMVDTLTEMITQFATHGKPKLGSTEWIPVNKDVLNVMNITGPNEFHMTTNTVRKSDIWDTIKI